MIWQVEGDVEAPGHADDTQQDPGQEEGEEEHEEPDEEVLPEPAPSSASSALVRGDPDTPPAFSDPFPGLESSSRALATIELSSPAADLCSQPAGSGQDLAGEEAPARSELVRQARPFGSHASYLAKFPSCYLMAILPRAS